MLPIVLFEDDKTSQLGALVHCRPAHQINIGGSSLLRTVAGLGYSPHAAARSNVFNVDWTNTFSPAPPPHFGGRWLLANSRLVPNVNLIHALEILVRDRTVQVVTVAGRLALASLSASIPVPMEWDVDGLTRWAVALGIPQASNTDLDFCDFPHDVMRNHPMVLSQFMERTIRREDLCQGLDGVFAPHDFVWPSHVAVDTRQGPVVLDQGVQLGAFCSLIGPLLIGPHARVRDHASLRGPLSIGSHSKVGGEIEASLIEDYANKGHFGYLGHSYVGSWVNLGAGTTSSNLKHTYGEIQMEYPQGRIPTGMQFLGALIGDFAKTSIQCGIMTGKILGVGSCSYGMVLENVPPFTNYARQFGSLTAIDLETILRTTERMMARRDMVLSSDVRRMLTAAYELTAPDRDNIPSGPVRF